MTTPSRAWLVGGDRYSAFTQLGSGKAHVVHASGPPAGSPP